MIPEKKEAFVTLATNDTYSLGCLVLGNSLRRVNTTRQLVVMVSIGVTNPMRSQLAQVFDVIQEVNVLDSNDPINLSLLGRPDLNVTFTKLHCWRLTQFDKAVFLDADTLVLQNVDELFDREELSAAPDAGWPDCFNSGVFVFKPSLETYQSLRDFATSQGSFDGGDQGLLNMFFKNWATEDISKHLPFIYNVVSQAFYSYLPAFTQFKDRVKIVHFIGAVKPWHHTFDTNTRTVQPLPGTGHSQEFLQVWWNIFIETVQPNLDPSLMGLVGELASMTIQSPASPPTPVSDAQRKLNWERGQIDYLGQDSFENIQRKIEETLNTTETAPAPVVMASPFAPKPADPKTAVVPRPEQTVAIPPPKAVAIPTSPVKPQVSSTVKVEPKAPVPEKKAPSATQPPAQPKVAPTVQPKVAPAVQPKVAPAVQPKGTASAQPVKVASTVQPKVTTSVQQQATTSVRPQVQSSVRPPATAAKPSTASGAGIRPVAPTRPAGSTQPATKTSGLNIQTSSKKK